MAFIVADGTEQTDATSYCDVAFADDYLGINPHNDAWIALTAPQKESYLMWATDTLDMIVDWKGYKKYATGSLAFPRLWLYDCEGYLLDSDIIPLRVKKATAFFANQLLIGSDPTAIDDTSAYKKLTVDVLTVVYKDHETEERIAAFLRSIIGCIGVFIGIGNLGFKPIVKV